MDDVGYGRDRIEDFVSRILESDGLMALPVLLIFESNGNKIGGAERWVVMTQQSAITEKAYVSESESFRFPCDIPSNCQIFAGSHSKKDCHNYELPNCSGEWR